MIQRLVDGNHDWQFGRGISDYAFNEDAIALNIKTRLLSWVGDCFFAPEEGIDWKARLDVGQQRELEAELRLLIQKSYGVVGVNNVSLEFAPSIRRLTATYEVTTIFSTIFQQTITQAIGGQNA